MNGGLPPLLTESVATRLAAARDEGLGEVEVSLDLERTRVMVTPQAAHWTVAGASYPYLDDAREHTVYGWDGRGFAAVSRFGEAFVKLVPTAWGPPTFEIDGVKMLPTATVSPWADAGAKVALVRPRGARVLDTCGGLGYFAAHCLAGGAAAVLSFERNADVAWLRRWNPWSPDSPWSTPDTSALTVELADVTARIGGLPPASFDAALHDPPRFAMAGQLYSRDFYAELARVLRPGGRLFHYTGAPNSRSRGRDLPAEVSARLKLAGFKASPYGDGVLARR